MPGAADYYNLTVSDLHTYAVGQGRYVVHNCNGELLDRAQEAAEKADRPAGAAAEIRGPSGKILFEDAVSSAPATDEEPFGGIVRAHRGDPETGRFAGGCAETCMARRIVRAAEDNPALRGRPISMALYHVKDRIPCATCMDVLQDLADRLDSRVSVVTNTGRQFEYWPR